MINSLKNRVGIFIVLTLFFLNSCGLKSTEENSKINMGYILNVTHAIPIIALEENLFSEKLEHFHFSSGGYLIK